ncbi:hypothetical protein Plhal703r1_c06g0031071 [Plasmopara halstedii]
MELETKDGKTFFCAASSAKISKSGTTHLSWNCNQRCEMDNASETEHDRRLRDHLAAN